MCMQPPVGGPEALHMYNDHGSVLSQDLGCGLVKTYTSKGVLGKADPGRL